METNRWPASASMINQDDHKGAKDCQNSLEESEIMLNSPDSPSSSASGYIGEETFDQSTRIVCTLCYCEIHSHMIHTIESCGCRFCVTCLRTYLILNIKGNNINGLVCPDPNCVTLKKPKRSISDRLLFRGSAHSKNRKQSKDLNGSVIRALTNGSSGSNGAKFTPQEIKLLVGNEMYSLYKKYKLIMDVDEDPNRTWCPKANCDTICLITKPSVGRLPASAAFSIKLTKSAKVSLTDGRSSFYCAKCNEVYCTTCRKKWHDKPLCKSSSEVELSAASDSRANGLDGSDVDSNIKRCPRCLVWIERDEGCAQMMCRKCKHVFCWFCLHSLEDDFFLRHYDKGPCKNRLGHSRPSVLWHRTQVIAIFAGLGLLLLLASPLFLIASPCILCCNSFCGSNCKYVEEKEGKEEEDNGFEFPPYP